MNSINNTISDKKRVELLLLLDENEIEIDLYKNYV